MVSVLWCTWMVGWWMVHLLCRWRHHQTGTHIYMDTIMPESEVGRCVCLCDDISSPVYPGTLTWWMPICRQPGDSDMWTHVQVSESWVRMCGADVNVTLHMGVWVREHRQAAHLLLLSTSRKRQYGEDLGWQSGRTRHVCRRWSRVDNMKVIFVYQLKLYRDINKLLSHASLIPS